MFELVVPRQEQVPEAVSELQALLKNSASLEHFIFHAVNNYYKLRICSVHVSLEKGEESALAIYVESNAYSKPKGPVADVFIPLSQLERKHRRYSLDGKFSKLADMPNYYPMPEWLEARDKRLRVREFGQHGEAAVSAAGMLELVLTYALSPGAEVQISHKLVGDTKYRPLSCAAMTLLFHGDDQIGGWGENIYVLLEKLAKYLNQDTKRATSPTI